MIDAADAIARLERSTRSFLDALNGVSEEAWRLRPTIKEWSLAETVEHVVLTNRLVRATLKKLLEVPLPPSTPRFDDAAINATMFDVAAPPRIDLAEPKGRFATRTEGIRALVEIHEELVAGARETTPDLRPSKPSSAMLSGADNPDARTRRTR